MAYSEGTDDEFSVQLSINGGDVELEEVIGNLTHRFNNDTSSLIPLTGGSRDDVTQEDGNEPPTTSINTAESSTEPYRIYPRRWYVLALFAILAIADNMVYSTMSPIAPIAEKALGLTQTDVSLLANWYNIMFILSVFPYMWLIQTKGLRMPVLSGITFVATGAFVRCLSTKGASPAFDRVLLHLGQIINGCSSSVLWFACTKLSVVWFPPSERAISTSFGLMSGFLGTAISFLVGPYTVAGLASKFAEGNEPSEENYALAIRFLLYIECSFCGILCALALFYFPSEPPSPPSYTAKSARAELRKGFMMFAKNVDCWLILILYSVSGATLGGWTQFLAISVQGTMSNVEAGWLGFVVTVAMVLSAPITSFTSRWWIKWRPKLICAGLLFIGASMTVVFLVAQVFVRSLLSPLLCWLTLVPAGFFITSCQPIWWEMASESAYPIPEQIVAGIFALGYTSFAAIYYTFYSFPSLGTQWANWCLAILECACVPIILFCSGKSRRSGAESRGTQEQDRIEIIQ